jgi:bifunctional DNase/RNase
MEIKGLLMDPVSNMPVVVLRDAANGVFLPIWVGIFEANAIAIQMEKIATPRPMTHDLLKNLLGELDATVERIVINDLRDNTFFARIHLLRGETRWDVDSRPSDAIALALRVKKSKTLRPDGDESDPERLKKWLEEVNPDDLGKYRM